METQCAGTKLGLTAIPIDKNHDARIRGAAAQTRVSSPSNVNSSSHSGTGQLVELLLILGVCGGFPRTTTHAPQPGHVTHEHKMRSATQEL